MRTGASSSLSGSEAVKSDSGGCGVGSAAADTFWARFIPPFRQNVSTSAMTAALTNAATAGGTGVGARTIFCRVAVRIHGRGCQVKLIYEWQYNICHAAAFEGIMCTIIKDAVLAA